MQSDTSIYYPFDLSGNSYLSIADSLVRHSEILPNGDIQLIECDINGKWMKLKTRDERSQQWIEKEMTGFKSDDILDLCDTGDRWEGGCINGDPFGYGKYFNKDNNIKYIGFIYNGMKVCIGTEYYEDQSIVQYEGLYYKNKRNGNGILYNKLNELVYDGLWINDNPMEFKSIIINCEEDEKQVTFCIEEIVIGDGYDSIYTKMSISGFSNLKKVKIGKESLKNVIELKLESMCNEY